MISQQGLIAYPDNSLYPRDYYGRPTYRECLMRFDFDQDGDSFPRRWRSDAPGSRPLGVAPSGRFAIYLMRWVPQYMTRAQVAMDLRIHVPPTDRFMLDFLNAWEWRREKVELPLEVPQLAELEVLKQNPMNDGQGTPQEQRLTISPHEQPLGAIARRDFSQRSQRL